MADVIDLDVARRHRARGRHPSGLRLMAPVRFGLEADVRALTAADIAELAAQEAAFERGAPVLEAVDTPEG